MGDQFETIGPFPNATEWFFLETLKDLEQRLKAGDEYNTIRAAGLLRQILLDKVPLIVAANRETRIKLRFIVPEPPESNGDRPILAFMPLGKASKIEEVTLDGLLRRIVLIFQGYDFTVREVVKAVANLRGGIHVDKPRNIQEAAITALNGFFTFRGSGGAVVVMVKSIGTTVLEGTIGLVEAIKSRTTSNLIPIPGQEGSFTLDNPAAFGREDDNW